MIICDGCFYDKEISSIIKSVSRRGIAIVVEFKIANDIDDLEKKAEEAIK